MSRTVILKSQSTGRHEPQLVQPLSQQIPPLPAIILALSVTPVAAGIISLLFLFPTLQALTRFLMGLHPSQLNQLNHSPHNPRLIIQSEPSRHPVFADLHLRNILLPPVLVVPVRPVLALATPLVLATFLATPLVLLHLPLTSSLGTTMTGRTRLMEKSLNERDRGRGIARKGA
jgi:hypothetical protein